MRKSSKKWLILDFWILGLSFAPNTTCKCTWAKINQYLTIYHGNVQIAVSENPGQLEKVVLYMARSIKWEPYIFSCEYFSIPNQWNPQLILPLELMIRFFYFINGSSTKSSYKSLFNISLINFFINLFCTNITTCMHSAQVILTISSILSSIAINSKYSWKKFNDNLTQALTMNLQVNCLVIIRFSFKSSLIIFFKYALTIANNFESNS